MQRLGDALKEMTHSKLAMLGGPRAVHLYLLASLPATAELQRTLEECQAQLEAEEQRWAAVLATPNISQLDIARGRIARDPIVRRLTEKVQELTYTMVNAAERDDVLKERPEGCTCLGLGGTGLLVDFGAGMHWSAWCPACPNGLIGQESYLAAAQSHFADVERQDQAERERDAEYGVQHAKIAWKANLINAHVPDKLRGLTFQTFEKTPGSAAKLEVANELRCYGMTGNVMLANRRHQPWVFLHGDAGVGKSGLAAATMHVWCGHDPGLWITMSDWLQKLRSAMSDNTTYRHIDAAKDAMFLVIDDLGGQRAQPSDWELSTIFDLMSSRYGSNRPTMMTSNFDLATTIERLTGRVSDVEADRLGDRIYDAAWITELVGTNLRMETS